MLSIKPESAYKLRKSGLAFELRLLSRRQPDRCLIDLNSDSDFLIAPQAYPRVPLPEDRLFIPRSSSRSGWRRDGSGPERRSGLGHASRDPDPY
jgi:hypothetical protein